MVKVVDLKGNEVEYDSLDAMCASIKHGRWYMVVEQDRIQYCYVKGSFKQVTSNSAMYDAAKSRTKTKVINGDALCETIAKARAKLGMNAIDFANAVNARGLSFSVDYVDSIEKGYVNLTNQKLQAICFVLGLSYPECKRLGKNKIRDWRDEPKKAFDGTFDEYVALGMNTKKVPKEVVSQVCGQWVFNRNLNTPPDYRRIVRLSKLLGLKARILVEIYWR